MLKGKTLSLLVGILHIWAINTLGQQPFSWRVTTDDGLKTNMVFDLEIDEEGKVWFGLFGGIASYDGHRVTMCAQHEDLSMSCTNLQFDGKGNIFCMNFSNELFRYNIAKDSIYKVSNNPIEGDPTFGDYLYWSNMFIFNVNEHVYFGHLFQDSICVDSTTKLSGRSRLLLNERKSNVYIIALNRSVKALDCIDLSSLKSAHTLPDHFNSSLGYYTMVDDRLLYFNNDTRLIKASHLDGKTQVVANLQNLFPEGLLSDIAIIDSHFWIGSRNGLFVLDKLGRPIHPIAQPFLTNEIISSIKQDQQGNIWISTTRTGVYVIPNRYIIDLLANNPSMTKHVAKSVALGNGGWMLASYDNNLYEYTSDLRLKFQYTTKQKEVINGLVVEHGKRVWASGHLGVEVFNWHQNQAQNFYGSHLIDYSVSGAKYLEMLDNTLFVPSWSGVFLVDLSSADNLFNEYERTHRLSYDYNNPRIQRERSLYSFVDTNSGDLWVQHPESPIIYNSQNPTSVSITNENGLKIEANITKCINYDNGRIIAATRNNGLFFIKNHKVEQHFTIENGLASNTIFDMAKNGNELWMATFRGIQMLNLKTFNLNTYGASFGIRELPYQSISVNENQVLVGHSTTSLLLNKKHLVQSTWRPPISFGTIRINQRDTALRTSYTLSHFQNHISISLSSFHYSPNKSFGFEYRELGSSSNWSYIPAEQGKVDFLNLIPGNYEWEFRAVNSFGQTSEDTQKLTFLITLPYYQRLWFQLLVIGLVLLITGIIVWWRIKSNNRQNRLFWEKAAVETEKQKLSANLRAAQLSAIKSQLNPHFMFNALNSIQEFILLKNSVQANKFLGKFSDLMRFTLDNSNAETISLDEELKMLKLYLELEALRFEESFSYELDILVPNPQGIEIPAMLIQPYIENAIKHGLLHRKSNKWLKVTVQLKDSDTLKVVVEDNGIGRENAAKIKSMRHHQHKSYASSANQKRLELLNSERQNVIAIKIEDLQKNGIAIGTRITLNIPF